jgi:hypothetical protein
MHRFRYGVPARIAAVPAIDRPIAVLGNEVITICCDGAERWRRIDDPSIAYFVCVKAPTKADWEERSARRRRLAAGSRADYG